MLQTYEPDECCEIGAAIALGSLDDKTEWECPECGMTWRAEIVGAVKHWKPVPVVHVL